jgi:branched-chain amino acid aminotransferase
MKIYIDGTYYDRENAKISVFDHGLLYGDGIFEGIRIYNNKIFKLHEHIVRLYQSAKSILLDIPMSIEEMEKAVIDAVKTNNKINGYIRLVITRGDGPLGLDPFQCKKSKVIIIVDDIKLYPEEFYKKGIEIMTSTYRRVPSVCLDPKVKSLNYLNNILAKIEAKNKNYLESILLNTSGYVAECTADNIFIIKNNEVLTPASYHGALEGITRNTVLELANSLDLKTSETSLTPYDLYNAEECFLTGTGAELIPVVKIDERIIGNGTPGAVTQKISSSFKTLVNS